MDEQQEPNIGYFPTQNRLSDESIRWQLDPEDVIQEIEYSLKNYVKINGSWQANDFNAKPMMTNEGISCFLQIIRSYSNKINLLGNIDEEQINMIMRDVCKTLRVFLVANHKRFEIEKSKFDQIKLNAENHIYILLSRPKNNGERLRWMKTQQVIENKMIDESKKKTGLF